RVADLVGRRCRALRLRGAARTAPRLGVVVFGGGGVRAGRADQGPRGAAAFRPSSLVVSSAHWCLLAARLAAAARVCASLGCAESALVPGRLLSRTDLRAPLPVAAQPSSLPGAVRSPRARMVLRSHPAHRPVARDAPCRSFLALPLFG